MDLSPRICYRALTSRDARFDGRFFTGVVTTGVYCRPVCPARAPLRRNVRFFPSAAAAEAAGFRPCLRCRPETSPGTPAWIGTSATVSRALRHIAAGALDQGGVTDLAARLGIGPRHLRRLFIEHVGAPPLAVAQTRRVQLAKRLIDDTRLPMARIAFDTGFSSVRRFNAALHTAYGRSPTALRRVHTGGTASAHNGDGGDARISLQLAYRPPLEWRRLLEYVGPRAIPGVEHVAGATYRRAVAFGDECGVVTVSASPERNALRLDVPARLSRHLAEIVERTRRVFDLGADPREILAHLRRDPVLAVRLRRRRDVRVPGAWNGFELALRAILGQQITVRGATTLAGRLVRACGEPLAAPCGPVTHLFPTPERIVAAELGGIGVPAARAAALQAVAGAVIARPRMLETPADLDAALAELTAVPGIGPWTANYVAMRALGEPDAFPEGDLGLRKAMGRGGRTLAADRLAVRAEAWRPWRAYAAMLLWTS